MEQVARSSPRATVGLEKWPLPTAQAARDRTRLSGMRSNGRPVRRGRVAHLLPASSLVIPGQLRARGAGGHTRSGRVPRAHTTDWAGSRRGECRCSGKKFGFFACLVRASRQDTPPSGQVALTQSPSRRHRGTRKAAAAAAHLTEPTPRTVPRMVIGSGQAGQAGSVRQTPGWVDTPQIGGLGSRSARCFKHRGFRQRGFRHRGFRHRGFRQRFTHAPVQNAQQDAKAQRNARRNAQRRSRHELRLQR